MESGSLTKRSWSLLREHPYLLGFTACSVAFSLAVMIIAIGLFVWLSGGLAVWGAEPGPEAGQSGGASLLGLLPLLIAGFLAVLARVFLTAALVHCANEELHHRGSGLTAGARAALAKRGPLARWSLADSAVGWAVSMSAGGVPVSGLRYLPRSATSWLLAFAWLLVTLLVLPFIMLRGLGALPAVRASAHMLRKTWRQNLAGQLLIVGALLVLLLPAGLLCFLGLSLVLAGGAGIVIGAGLLVVGAAVVAAGVALAAALRAVFAVVLLDWATSGAPIGSSRTDSTAGAVPTPSPPPHPNNPVGVGQELASVPWTSHPAPDHRSTWTG